jgi:hypothetical protein
MDDHLATREAHKPQNHQSETAILCVRDHETETAGKNPAAL